MIEQVLCARCRIQCQLGSGLHSDVKVPRSALGSEAQEAGGGEEGMLENPAMLYTADKPVASCWRKCGTSSSQNIVNRGSVILFRDGRLSQSWKNSVGLGAVSWIKGNISQ